MSKCSDIMKDQKRRFSKKIQNLTLENPTLTPISIQRMKISFPVICVRLI